MFAASVHIHHPVHHVFEAALLRGCDPGDHPGAAMNQFVYESGFLVKAHDLVGKLVREHRDLSPAFSRKIHGPAKDAEI